MRRMIWRGISVALMVLVVAMLGLWAWRPMAEVSVVWGIGGWGGPVMAVPGDVFFVGYSLQVRGFKAQYNEYGTRGFRRLIKGRWGFGTIRQSEVFVVCAPVWFVAGVGGCVAGIAWRRGRRVSEKRGFPVERDEVGEEGKE